MADDKDLSAAWAEVEARLPEGWSLDALRCASTGLSPGQRSDDWIAVAVGPDSAEREACADSPLGALAALISSFEQDDGERATLPRG
jgi:hypothetical protein